MAVIRRLSKVAVNLLLNKGTKDDKVQTQSKSLGKLNVDRYDDQKASDIANLLTPLLDKDVYLVQEVRTSTLTRS